MKNKLLLFDIDGTLISAHGIPKKAMGKVLSRRYASFNYDKSYDFSGRTDPEIIEHLLKYDNKKVSDILITQILEEFCVELEQELTTNHRPVIHPGVEDLIEDLDSIENVSLGLVTGNVAEGARIKLEAVDLYKYFPVGGFGDDSKRRNDLPPIAKTRAQDYYHCAFSDTDIWIIGDSIYDVECARVNSLRCLAVCTGFTNRQELYMAGPEILVDNMSDTVQIRDTLLQS
jgi:HAD superfamily hydrolase (TIGR01549 family)